MTEGLPVTSLVPVRKMPSDKSEMVTQVLFGQKIFILENLNSWARIHIADDGQEGWADRKMIRSFDTAPDLTYPYVLPWFLTVKQHRGTTEYRLPPGSIIYRPDRENQSFHYGDRQYSWEGSLPRTEETNRAVSVCSIARRLTGSPYLWGGKSPCGIDCSGLVQLIFSIHGIFLPRDANEQAETGSTVSFIQEACAGDLAFMGSPEGQITHVGIITGKGTIIHASGMVREDKLDQEGIYNAENRKYSHFLRLIKRIL
ncbi:MAG: NlpC/P60 family protein [Bacteroidales bacterium]